MLRDLNIILGIEQNKIYIQYKFKLFLVLCRRIFKYHNNIYVEPVK